MTARQMLATQLHRRCGKTVLGKNTGDARTGSKPHQQHIGTPVLANTGGRRTQFDTGHRPQCGGIRRYEINRHIVVSF